jgi:hypothetical protein
MISQDLGDDYVSLSLLGPSHGVIHCIGRDFIYIGVSPNDRACCDIPSFPRTSEIDLVSSILLPFSFP